VTAKNEWITEFLDFCAKNKVPVDFITTHHYPTDAFGQIGADTQTQLEHAPPGIMCQDASRVREQAGALPVYYTEWNISSNPRDPLHDEPFAATFVAKIIMEAAGLVQGYSFWTFSDIFAENYFPSIPFQGGFGLLNIHGIPKPTYRAFELLHHLGTELLGLEGTHDTVSAWAIHKGQSITVLLTNHAMPRHPIQIESVNLRLTGASRPRTAYVERIDQDHANPRRHWHDMGEPHYLTKLQIEQLKAASSLVQQTQPLTFQDGILNLSASLPPQGVAAITIEFAGMPNAK